MDDAVKLSRFRTAYSPRVSVSLSFSGAGRTKQSFRDECDINTIMARYMATGVLPMPNQLEARYADVTGIDYQNAMEVVADARSMFENLPSKIRDRFQNDPAQLLEFVHNEVNHAEAVELGLAVARPVVAAPVVAAPVAAPAVAAPAAPAVVK